MPILAEYNDIVCCPYVSLQFSFSKKKHVPLGLPSKGSTTKEDRKKRKEREHSTETISLWPEPIQEVSLEVFVNQLRALGYKLIDASTLERSKDDGTKYDMCRFLFLSKKELYSNDYRENEELYHKCLNELVFNVNWRIRAYKNPYYKDGEVVEGSHTLSINCEPRQPLKNLNNKTLIQNFKDNGEFVLDFNGSKIEARKEDRMLVTQNKALQIISR